MGPFETRRIPLLFVAATLVPIAALCWLGVRTLDHERDLERKRRRERLEVAAARVALDIEQHLQRVEGALVDGTGIRLVPAGLESTGNQPVLFQPELTTALPFLSGDLFAAAQQEQRAPAAAIAAYQRLAAAAAPATRAEAFVALGGLLRRQRRFEQALHAYARLEPLGAELVAGGQPAALVARQGRAKTFLESGDTARLREEAAALSRELETGRWTIDAITFDLYREMARTWGGPEVDSSAIHRATAAGALWQSWRRGELPARGRRFVDVPDASLLAVWVAGRDGPVAAIFSNEELQRLWRPFWESKELDAALSLLDGRPMFGAVRPDAATLLPSSTGFPFVLAVGPFTPHPGGTPLRAQVVLAGIGLACALMIAVSFGLYRVTTRELTLARQQSDFVAAVSHEFRTPLTSMRHLIDLLATRGISSEERKAHYYGLLAGETERLQRMVETLLSFGRIDASAHVWHMEPVDVQALIAAVGREFRREVRGYELTLEVPHTLPKVRADREALTRAIWNLLENAAKYSPPGSPIRVFATTSPDVVSGFSRARSAALFIGVQDHGIGIPVAEQERIFQKFVRGEEAKRAGIRGVGVGLALVKRIIEAHGGAIAVASAVGRGSTFTVALPVDELAERAVETAG